ncbi:hypothetical protein RZE82_09305 [Mollicutes bacterium LVI A0039]|nr:hypothetical protein RZE82_09305 [Mollicutes bacterium LVI A0039]
MNVTVILETDKYLALAKQLGENPQINVEVTNIDFDLTSSITSSQVIVFFGAENDYLEFFRQYRSLLESKLIIKTGSLSSLSSKLSVAMKINSGVGVCAIPDLEQPIRAVIIETINTIFDKSLKIINTTPTEFANVVETITSFEDQIQNLCENAEDRLGTAVALHMFKNFELK